MYAVSAGVGAHAFAPAAIQFTWLTGIAGNCGGILAAVTPCMERTAPGTRGSFTHSKTRGSSWVVVNATAKSGPHAATKNSSNSPTVDEGAHTKDEWGGGEATGWAGPGWIRVA